MKKRKPKQPPDWADNVLTQLGKAKAEAKHSLSGADRLASIAADRTKRRHGAAALLKTLEAIKTARALNEAEKRIGARPDPWDLPEGQTQSDPEEKPLAHPVRERMDLVPWNAVLAVAQTMTEGIKTHDEGAWRKLSQREHVSRALRHLALFLTGDCAEPHLHHAAARSLMALEMSEPEGADYVEKD